LTKNDKSYNFQKYNEEVSRVVNWLHKKDWVWFSFDPQKGAQKRCNRRSVQISTSGRRFWDYLLKKYGTKGLLAAQFDLDSAYKKLAVPQTLSGLGLGICTAVVFFAGFIAFLFVMNALSSFL